MGMRCFFGCLACAIYSWRFIGGFCVMLMSVIFRDIVTKNMDTFGQRGHTRYRHRTMNFIVTFFMHMVMAVVLGFGQGHYPQAMTKHHFAAMPGSAYHQRPCNSQQDQESVNRHADKAS